MKNLYLVETNAFNAVVLHDTDDKIVSIVDVDADITGFKLNDIDSFDYGIKEQYFNIDEVEEFLGVDCIAPDAPKIIETIENWEG